MDPHRHAHRRVHGPGEEVADPKDAHPPWRGERSSLRDALSRGEGRVAGRYARGRELDLLQDATAAVELVPGDPRPAHGDQVVGRVVRDGERWALREVETLAAARREPTPELLRLERLRPALEARARVLDAVRAFFREHGFLEVETPARAINPGLEPHLVPFALCADRQGDERYLVTSPELHLKRLLPAGYERVFEVARAFRDDERGDRHVPEFTLLEWYRTHAGLPELAADVDGLLTACARSVDATVDGCDVTAGAVHATWREAFTEHAGVDPDTLDPDERERRFVEDVETRLGFGRPLLLSEFPADDAALARLVAPRAPGPAPLVAGRMELYVAGVELANGFDELNDPDEQRRRHEADRRARQAAGAAVPPLDEGFLAALEAGSPPAAGMALGIDRLVMVLLGATKIADVRAFVD